MNRKRVVLFLALALALLLGLAASAQADTSSPFAHQHSWSGWTVTQAATCTKAGKETRTCATCGQKETRTISAGHKWGRWIVIEKATCNTKGLSQCTCSVCKKTENLVTPATGRHSWTEWETIKAATCTDAGLRTHFCKNCGTVEEKEIRARGGQHKWDAGVVTQEPGFLEPGLKTYTCTRCGDTKTEEIPVNAPLNGGSIMDQLHNIPPDAGTSEELRIVTQPVGVSIDPDGSLSLTVEAAGGTPPYTYQWRGMSSVTDWPFWFNVENGTDSTLEAQKGNRRYYCQVYDAKGNHVDSAKVQVTYNLYIAQQPENTATCEMDPVILTCKAAGGMPFTDAPDTYYYTWYDIDGNPVGYGQEFEVPGVGEYHLPKTGQYLCEVEDAAGNTVTSKAVWVYDADPFEAKTDVPVVELLEGQDYELWAQAYGGIKSYTGVWLRDGVEIPTQPGENGEFTAPILGDGSKEVVYTFLATDAMDDAASCTVTVIYPQLKIAQQPVGGMLPADGSPLDLSVVMAEGEAPFFYTLYLYKDGIIWMGPYIENNHFEVNLSAEYYIHIEDATGRWADSDVAVVTEFSFQIEQIYVDGPIVDSAGTTLKAVTSGGVEPITYTWWYCAEDGHYEQLARGYEPTCTAYRPGKYLCNAEDAEKHFAQEDAQVIYTGKAPIILEQPESQTLPYKAGQKYYSASLVCKAVAADGTTDSLEYVWQTKLSGGWLSGTPSSDTYTMTAISVKGTWPWRCVVTDTRNGEQVISNEARVGTTLVVTDAVFYHSDHSFDLYNLFSIHFKGGIGPYTLKIFALRRISDDKEVKASVYSGTYSGSFDVVKVGNSYINSPNGEYGGFNVDLPYRQQWISEDENGEYKVKEENIVYNYILEDSIRNRREGTF